ncbi:DNA polymerase IV [Acetobacter orientalis]|uniref:DNA polymerase IV n=1 Tax=Acetobacter orientalis TaxID=146474 RepID=A0A2Z5ZGN1_9PROT|nr:DNA polymerase IV [Acetobacter orientalis]
MFLRVEKGVLNTKQKFRTSLAPILGVLFYKSGSNESCVSVAGFSVLSRAERVKPNSRTPCTRGRRG